MTKKERAVAVAKDVLNMLRRKNRVSVLDRNGYLIASCVYNPDHKDLRDILPQIMNSECQVCARGAILLSKAKLFDHVPLSAVSWPFIVDNTRKLSVNQSDTTTLLKDTFSDKNLTAIEAAFEKGAHNSLYLADNYLYGAVVFGMKYKDPEKRLAAIMRNIIKNNGDFLPPPKTREEYLEVAYASTSISRPNDRIN